MLHFSIAQAKQSSHLRLGTVSPNRQI